ncbi:unnamed protein product [Dovyalis caffra]|uniref:Secreted protein n=1 Tax=Dovyalis caffra TaxID=77055 RepID=A0AAV1QR83_9ROSI|nr:unnamed protein product [Dovyalis caffra]
MIAVMPSGPGGSLLLFVVLVVRWSTTGHGTPVTTTPTTIARQPHCDAISPLANHHSPPSAGHSVRRPQRRLHLERLLASGPLAPLALGRPAGVACAWNAGGPAGARVLACARRARRLAGVACA